MRELPWLPKPDPDYQRLINAVRRQGRSDQVPRLELFADREIIAAFLEEPVPLTSGEPKTKEKWKASLNQKIRFWHRLGYDAIWDGPEIEMPGLVGHRVADDTAGTSRKKRNWVEQGKNRITNWDDFEKYPWPDSNDANYFAFEYMSRHLPDGMGLLAWVWAPFEMLSLLMGFETLSYALYDQPDLIEAILEKYREVFLPQARAVLEIDRVIALWIGDDMGFKTGPLISPKHLRRYFLPLHKELAGIAHGHNMPYMLHSCGKLDTIMEDLIEDVGIDAKHSFEDAITPVETFSAKYGQRIGVVGGLDVDLLSRSSADDVRTRTRSILEACSDSGGYILGSGNSITNYIPLDNFLAMVEEGVRFNQN